MPFLFFDVIPCSFLRFGFVGFRGGEKIRSSPNFDDFEVREQVIILLPNWGVREQNIWGFLLPNWGVREQVFIAP